jgi:hypothetical protein
MSERTWGEAESAPPPKKKGIPTWLWFCGGGCLLAVIIGIGLVAWLASRFSGSTDPEKQWPKVAEILPYDERPPELNLKFGFDLGMGMYFFEDKRGFMAVLMHMGMGGDKDRRQLMNPESEMGFLGQRKDAKAAKITVQGRELDVLRFQHIGGSSGPSSEKTPQVESGQAALVDLTPDDQSGFLILQLVRTHSSEEIGNEDIIRFLKPFHVGPNR